MTAVAQNHPVNSKRISLVSISVLTVLFVAAYFALRALPDAQCGFLHYEEIVNADGSVEFCATNHAGFLDLTRLKYPVEMGVFLADEPKPGVAQEVTLELLTSGGTPIAPHQLAMTHTKKMHVMVVDPSLRDYHHVHPQADGLNGQYTFEFTPELAGTYQVFTEIVPLRTRRQIIGTGVIEVAGIASAMEFDRNTQSVVDGIRFDIGEVPERLRTGTDYRFDLTVTTEGGDAVDLQDIMGAKGHMVAFDAARKGFAHMHPIDSVVSARSLEVEQGLAFLFNVPNPGWYRVFAQIQVEGREVFGHFDLEVE
ncbi:MULTISPECIES: hypothetical protein [unclassified Lentimonas]|uniref:hypothetical protein n=1 Tax=unclassified Lentimonas TaxID=2630993 RepID=UPI0013287497|nr:MULTISPECIES: hypothetical protein [unclassified Lentimonas]CAA6678791.1 Unannotated [Lentimonas sp. CC4]CAA6684394.1 Unannotated [Lentimonas sp. CC6]CAA7077526.1 Unannotated [Lentimonas sp. CC4]CAA7171360.1 Unannotated [Lentimonas sp. CC21]CAA7183390.1 Unannotated [Lentimonas sp. CC8]